MGGFFFAVAVRFTQTDADLARADASLVFGACRFVRRSNGWLFGGAASTALHENEPMWCCRQRCVYSVRGVALVEAVPFSCLGVARDEQRVVVLDSTFKRYPLCIHLPKVCSCAFKCDGHFNESAATVDEAFGSEDSVVSHVTNPEVARRRTREILRLAHCLFW